MLINSPTSGSYRRYKVDTDVFITWLYNYPPLVDGGSMMQSLPQDWRARPGKYCNHATHQLSTKDFLKKLSNYSFQEAEIHDSLCYTGCFWTCGIGSKGVRHIAQEYAYRGDQVCSYRKFNDGIFVQVFSGEQSEWSSVNVRWGLKLYAWSTSTQYWRQHTKPWNPALQGPKTRKHHRQHRLPITPLSILRLP